MDSSDNPVAGWMLFLLFIVINSIFYGFGSAIQNLNENEIEDKAEQGDKKSKLLLHIMNAPGSLIQTVQFYHMLLSFLVGYVQLKSIMKTVSVSLSATAAGVFFTENPGKIILCILVLFVDLILLATFGILSTKKNLLSTCSSFRLSDGTYGAGRYYSGLADYKIDGTFNQSHRTPVWY